MTLIAMMATVLAVWAISGKPVQPWAAAFAGFSCGFCWALVYAMHAIEKARL